MNNKLYKLMNWPRIEAIIYSEEDEPWEILGPHVIGLNVLFQFFWPEAATVNMVYENGDKQCEMELVDEAGFFACLLIGKIPEEYHYEIKDKEGNQFCVKDAYRYETKLPARDIDKFNAGINYTIYERLGAHPMTVEGVSGTYFAVWAPNATRVSVVGDFNHWDGRIYQMNRDCQSGIFQLFIPDVHVGDCYKYEIKAKTGLTFLKADPYAFGSQLRPDTASVVQSLSYEWKDDGWMKTRVSKQEESAPISVYELYLGSFIRNDDTNDYRNYRELADAVLLYVKEMGYTHVELMPVMEHPTDASWGYQVIGYYAPTSRYGSPEDFMYFVDTLHRGGVGVILDWVPAHFPGDLHGLAGFDGTCLYEHLDPRKGVHPKLGTLLYNYGRPQVSNYLIANALYWVEVFHVDGIRMDAVASMLYLDYGRNEGEWVANLYGGNENLEAIEMLKHLNSIMKKRNPGVLMIAQESSAYPNITGQLDEDGLGFDLKWNEGCIHDFLTYVSYDPYFRSHHHNELTFSMIYAYSEKFLLPLSYGEVVHGKSTLIGKMPGTFEDKFSNLRLVYAYMMSHPGKKMIFMGQDIGEFTEFDETKEVQWSLLQYDANKGINRLVRALNDLYKNQPGLYRLDNHAKGFEWINNISPESCIISFIRKTDRIQDTLVIVANFANIVQTLRVGVPHEGRYKEILNTDDKKFGGQGRVNCRSKIATKKEEDGRPYSINITTAPLSLSIFSYASFSEKEEQQIARRKAQQEAKIRVQEAQLRADVAKKEAKDARLKAEAAEKLANEAMEKALEAERLANEELVKSQRMKGK